MNGAPGKLRYERGGPSYVPHYLKTTDFIGMLIQMTPELEVTAAAPCNTAHKRLPEFLDDTIPHLDIRDAVLRDLAEKSSDSSSARAIILGTPTTTGIGSPEKGLYQQYIDDNGINVELIMPNHDQQDRITEAIYQIKSGNIKEAREIIMSVITQIREALVDDDLEVILGCTELPNAFIKTELGTNTMLKKEELFDEIDDHDTRRRMSVSSTGDLDLIPLEKGLIDPTAYLADEAALKEKQRSKELDHRHNIDPIQEEEKLSEEKKYSEDLAYFEEEERIKKEENDSPMNSPGASPKHPGRSGLRERRLITEQEDFRR